MFDGWCRSAGVTAEINFAHGLGLPIEFSVRGQGGLNSGARETAPTFLPRMTE